MGDGKLTQWAVQLASLLFLGAAFVFVYQGYLWLKLGVWVPIPAAQGIEALGIDIQGWQASIEWAGVRKIADWLLDVATTVWLIVLGVGLLWGAVTIEDRG